MSSADPFDIGVSEVVSWRDRITLVNGRTFTVARPDGSIIGGSEGTVFEDIRMLSLLVFEIRAPGGDATLPREHLTTSSPTPFSSVSVSRRRPRSETDVHEPTEFYAHRQWVGRGVRHDFEIHNSGTQTIERQVILRVGSDFAHVFEMKAGQRRDVVDVFDIDDLGRLGIVDPDASRFLRVSIDAAPEPAEQDTTTGQLRWDCTCPPRGTACISVTFEPVWHGRRSDLLFGLGERPELERRIRISRNTGSDVLNRAHLQLGTTDERLSRSFERSLTDLASLRIFDPAAPTNVVVAAGAPWFMTVFGRDSLLTVWMALPFVPDLAVGVLTVLGNLQGSQTRPESEEEPGKILHELRREGGSDAFARRGRYYGTVDATPLYVMLAAEAHRWGQLDGDALTTLWPHVVAAIGWIRRARDRGPNGFVSYLRSTSVGLTNQGWKDSWDGITFADGRLPTGPIALTEVQGYTYAALLGAAYLSGFVDDADLDAAQLQREADDLRSRFEDTFWDEASCSYAIGMVDGNVPIDSITTNPGHAIWAGIADPDRAARYLNRCVDGDLWTGWGLRTLSPTAAAFNPLSYHNGSVWPHDTALVIAGAARLGQMDLVGQMIDGSLDACDHFAGRPPELFAGTDRADFPAPIDYPNSCSPQAWASASVLMNIRSSLGLAPPKILGSPPSIGKPADNGLELTTLSGVHVGNTGYRIDLGAQDAVVSAIH